jgi:hypothetical protein
MNITTKYEIGEKVFFLYPKNQKEIGNVQVYSGEIINILTSHSNGRSSIKYLLNIIDFDYDEEDLEEDCDEDGDDDTGISIKEQFLFKNEADLLKFFQQNIRFCLNPNNKNKKRKSRKEEDEETEEEERDLLDDIFSETDIRLDTRGDRLLESLRRYHDIYELPK